MLCCGLIIERAERESIPVPLIGVSVQARIVDLVAEVTIEQRYVNKENQPIEAVYLFPLDEGAGVSKFTAEVDGRVIEGVVKETEQAKTDYDEAIKSGHSAFLVEEKLPDVFKAKVGNLAPGSGAKIRLTYVTELKVEGKEIRFYLPTTIAPRYIPPTDKSSTAADLATIKYSTESNYQVDFNATVQMASAITEIRSPTHKIAVTIETLSISLNMGHYDSTICRAKPKSPKGTTALMLSLVPSFKLTEQKTELIFLVDRSGSMGGSGINQAKQALQLFLHSLPLDCYVNIAGFGSSYKELFPASRKYDESVLNLTKQHVDSIDANLVGTEIFHPLETIFKKPSIEGYFRQIFVLTDGEVSNADEILGLIRRQNGQARVFALGLGSSASHYLVEGMARAGNGTALFASLEERLEKKVMQQLQDSLQPALSDIKIKWDGHEETEQKLATANAVPVQTEKTLMGFG
ncbi:von Willebrand factor A domain-containing protein 5A-like [Daphnia pulicaria]|uniref:von Willebrand factor A domain-containing protein 5A-like n=1 Tax=Daphnia pulicaria TaxID=35523 RepID=UPI001EECE86B|nr:von Willebrand factor A domain-containing protein 5A-like [Daphnia pulicaria]